MKKNILIIASKSSKGIETYITTYASALKEKYNVHILTLGEKTKETNKEENLIEFDTGKSNLFSLKNIKDIKKIKKKLKINYSISFGVKANFCNCLTKKNDKIITFADDYISKSMKKYVSGFGIKIKIKVKECIYNMYIFRKSNKIVVTSFNNVEDIDKLKKDKTKLVQVNNFVDCEILDNIKNMSTENKYDYIFESKNVIISPTSKEEPEATLYLIKAFKYVVNEIPDAKLIMLSEIPLMTKLNQCALEEEIYNSIMVIEEEPNISKYLNKPDLLVSTFLYQRRYDYILEGMYLGLPILSIANDFGTKNLLGHNKKTDKMTLGKYGILLPNIIDNKLTEEEYIKIIYKSIVNILKDKNLKEKYSKLSKQRSKDFDSSKFLGEWISLIEG